MADIMAGFKLTADEESTLRAAADTVKQLHAVIKTMTAAGLDMTAELESLNRAEQIRTSFLKSFGARAHLK